ncbi:solute carrier family 25 member 43 isoform X2 [Rhinopithecus roxellana]|uniref:solute carrier family 25 member 43 isoform X2 n=1 Tax=Papio anubis TaxID=9555 RepID=UPI000B7B31F1|nr:solute carrier family 25 member 43 isoform X2 [Papio anubis]XP_030790635.1 solute carrier family 25 member 43 isoform X2 [Rhinopithecus roxellana]
MATWRRDGRLTGGQRLLCAGLAGALSLSLTAPLELATVLAQVGVVRGHARGPWATGHRVWRAEGPRALWKGNAVACLRLFPCSVVQLAAYRKFVVMFTDDLGHISQWSSIMAGSLAGMVSTIVTYPTDLIKTRLIVQNMLEPSYRGLLHAFSTIYQQEGFLALYRGVSLTVVGALPFSAGSLLVHMNLEKIWNGPRDQFSLPQNFANVCLAAAVTQTLSFPFETVKRKMQIAPYFGIMFSTFEFCKRICLYQNGYILSPLSYKLTPGVDQSLQPQELRELKKFFKTRKLKSKKPTL